MIASNSPDEKDANPMNRSGAISLGRVLFADDDEPFRISLGERLKRAGYQCDYATSAKEAIELLRGGNYDVLLSDINMPGNAGLELIESAPSLAEGLPIVLLTGQPTVETAMRSVRMRVVAYLVKPPDFTELCQTLTAAIFESGNLRILKANRRRLQDWDREVERLQLLLLQTAVPERNAAMRNYLQLTLRNLVVGLVELEALFRRDNGELGAAAVMEKQTLIAATRKTVAVLQKTKDHFKSRELAELRRDLEALLQAADPVPPR